MPKIYPHTQDVAEVIEALTTNLAQGLSQTEAASRLQKNGSNEIARAGRRNFFKILKDQFVNPMILLLLAVIGISLILSHITDAIIIGMIVMLNAWIGFYQEFKAERAMQAIRRIASPEAAVMRDGKVVKIPARDIVTGDIVRLEAGNKIPADLRLTLVASLQVDESLLTGESAAIYKQTNPLDKNDLVMGDQTNMAFAGTMVVGGHGIGIAVATGQKTELGRIASLLNDGKKSVTPLQQRLQKLTRQLVLAAFFLCFVLFGIGLLYDKPFIDMLLAAISLGIASIPEGLPAVITISLSLGSLRLAKHGALVRRLQAVEGLGSVTVICADKTGTLTQNRMTVRYPDSENQNPDFLNALVLCNDADLEHGDPMEIALLKFVKDKGIDLGILKNQWKRVFEKPFDNERKLMSTLHDHAGESILYMKGAPEKVLALCTNIFSPDGIHPLTESKLKELETKQQELASQGLRLLAVAMKKGARSTILQNNTLIENELTFLGFVGLQDPPRLEALAAIAECRAAGIRPVMITGDHQATAMAIARELGIYRDGDTIITGADMKRESPEWLKSKAALASVFARVSPEDKLSIIQILKERNEFVVMTGDGVNDAPALKRADVGIAMGRGTDVAKEASSIILVDENFATIVSAVREGRIIYDNIRKFVRYMLTTNLGEIITMLLATLIGLPIPLLPIQLLWINLVTDGLPAITLGYEAAEGNVMARKPRPASEGILGQGLWLNILWVGLLMGILTVGTVFVFFKKGYPISFLQTIAFTSLTFAQMGQVLAIRSETRSLWHIGIFSNWRLAGAVCITILSQVAILNFSDLQKIFHIVPLTLPQFLFCCVPALLIYLVVEIEKIIRNRFRKAAV